MLRAAAVLMVFAVACSSPVPAPDVGAPTAACADTFCVEYPADWTPTIDSGFLSFQHSTVPEAIANASTLDPEGIVLAAGGTWPASAEDVVEAFWELLADGSGASLSEISVLEDGSVRSEGGFEDGRLWHRMVIAADGSAIGIEMRAPNSTWSDHADVLLDSLIPLP